MNNKDMNFIKTDSAESAQKLRNIGFMEIPNPNSTVFCFVNDNKKLIFDAEIPNVIYTNILCL